MRILDFTLAACVLLALFFLLTPLNRTDRGVSIVKLNTTALSSALTAFKSEYGNYPGGTNREIVNQLCGENPKHIFFIEVSPKDMSPEGDLLDRWKRPYRFNLVDDPKKPHVWSLGKNGIDDSANAKSDDLRSWE